MLLEFLRISSIKNIGRSNIVNWILSCVETEKLGQTNNAELDFNHIKFDQLCSVELKSVIDRSATIIQGMVRGFVMRYAHPNS